LLEQLQGKKKGSQKNSTRYARRKKHEWMLNIPSEAFATFRYSAHLVPKATNLFNKA
jgi:hypothetical protein